MMRVTFVLPGYPRLPVGGFKIVYEYANHLARRGHRVALVHPRSITPSVSPIDRAKRHLWPLKMRVLDRRLVPWFPIDPRVRVSLVSDLRPAFIPDGDFVFATGWQTAEPIVAYPGRKGIKMYLVQDFELWMTEAEEVRRQMAATYRMGINMVATSSAVEEFLAANGTRPLARIFHGLDFADFHVTLPIAERNPRTIGFPVRRASSKGTTDAVQAAGILQQQYGDALEVHAFGADPWPDRPAWVRYRPFPSNAELADFYNSLAVFVLPSHYEAWGLPGVEALACGAALVTADSIGGRDFARHGETALVVPRERPELIAAAVRTLLEDDALRRRLAAQGNAHVQQYTWTAAVDSLEGVLNGLT
jgi:glycosyltransferase involved in cell wall biosynthesis